MARDGPSPEADRTVLGDRPVRIVGDLPRMALRAGERAGVPPPDRRRAGPENRAAGGRDLGEDTVDLLRRPRVVRGRDPAPAAGILDAGVLGELLPAPEPD